MRWLWKKPPILTQEEIEAQLYPGTGREKVSEDTRRRYAEQPKPDNGPEER